MAKVYKLQRVEYHSLNKYYEQNISEDQLRLIFNRANLSEEYQHDLLEALADPASDLHQEVWDILRDDEDFSDGWEFTEEDLWTDRKGGYDIEDTCEDMFDDGSEV